MLREYGERLFILLCGFEQALRIVFIILVIFFLLTLLSLFIVDPGSGVYLIVLYNLVMFGGGLLAVSIVIRKCSTRGR
jgi:hypothetical protein